MHSLGSAGSFECRVSGFVLHGRRSQHSLQRKHVCVVEFQISRWHWVASKHQGPFLGESRPCASLPAPAPTCSSSPWYPPKRRLSSSALQTFSEHLLFSQKRVRTPFRKLVNQRGKQTRAARSCFIPSRLRPTGRKGHRVLTSSARCVAVTRR